MLYVFTSSSREYRNVSDYNSLKNQAYEAAFQDNDVLFVPTHIMKRVSCCIDTTPQETGDTYREKTNTETGASVGSMDLYLSLVNGYLSIQ